MVCVYVTIYVNYILCGLCMFKRGLFILLNYSDEPVFVFVFETMIATDGPMAYNNSPLPAARQAASQVAASLDGREPFSRRQNEAISAAAMAAMDWYESSSALK